MQEILDYQILKISAYRYFIGLGIIILSIIIKIIFDKIISKGLKKWANKTKFVYDDILIEALIPPFRLMIVIAGIYFATTYILLEKVKFIPPIVGKIMTAIILTIILWSVYRLTEIVTEVMKNIFDKSDKILSKQFVPIVRTSLRAIVLIIGGIMIVQNLGINVSSLLAGVGIGGIAIALAAQDAVSNIFGTFIMFSDRPFRIGDYIEFKNVSGVVESIGLRSTKIRTFDKSLITVPNKLVTSEMVQNWSARPKRRIKFNVGLTYNSTSSKIKELIKNIRDYIKSSNDFDKEDFVVNFTEFKDSSLSIFINCFAATTNYKEYLRILEDFNITLMKMVEDLELEFAFPTQSIYLEKGEIEEIKEK